jgi:hypothetical protein
MTSELPGPRTSVWTTKLDNTDWANRHIILGFLNATLVLSIGEASIMGQLTNLPTIAMQQLDKNRLLQIQDIHLDGGITEWKVFTRSNIVFFTSNRCQVVGS